MLVITTVQSQGEGADEARLTPKSDQVALDTSFVLARDGW